VTCSQGDSCVAVGRISYLSEYYQGLIESLTSGVWTAMIAPLPANASGQNSLVESVACTAPGSCIAVGRYAPESDYRVELGFMDTLSDGTWSTTQAPLPTNASAGSDNDVQSVACAMPDTCTAVGGYYDTSLNGETGLIETVSP
jgi:hypothetical protein